MNYTVIKNDTVLFSGIIEPNVMNYKNMDAILIVRNSEGDLVSSKAI